MSRALGRTVLAIALAAAVAMIAVGVERVTSHEDAGPTPRSGDIVPNPFESHHEVSVLGRVPVTQEVDGPFPADAFVHLDSRTIEPVPPAITSRLAGFLPAQYAVSPNGSTIAYVANADGVGEIRLARLDGSRRRLLVRAPAEAPSWSPDGSEIVFEGAAESIRIVDVATGEVRRIAGGDEVWLPTVAPDGRTVLFTRATRDRRLVSLWSVSVDGGRPTLIRRHAGYGAYSPDGGTIAFHRLGHAVEPGEIYPFDFAISLMDADGTDRRTLRVKSAGRWHMAPFDWGWTRPVWSPDGTRIAYQRYDITTGDVWVVDVSTRRITDLGTGSRPVWIDDSTLVVEDLDPSTGVFGSGPFADLGTDPTVLDLATGAVTVLPGSIVSLVTRDPGFAPSSDGSRVAFTGRTLRGDRALYVADLDGRHLEQVSRSTSWVASLSAAWSHDGTMLTYVDFGRTLDVHHVYVVDLATGERTSVAVAADGSEQFWAPVFAPDGRTVLVTKRSTRPGPDTLDLWSIPVSGGHPSLLIADAAFGSYSPDGSTIAYRRATPADDDFSRPISLDVKLASADGRRLGALGDGGSVMAPLLSVPGERPLWSPNGRRLVAMISLHGGFRVHVVHIMTGRGPALGADASAAWIDNHALLVEREEP